MMNHACQILMKSHSSSMKVQSPCFSPIYHVESPLSICQTQQDRYARNYCSHTDVETNIYPYTRPHVRLLLHPSNTYQTSLTHTQIQPNLRCAATPPLPRSVLLPVTPPLPLAEDALAFSDGTLLLAPGFVLVAVSTTASLIIADLRINWRHVWSLELLELLVGKANQLDFFIFEFFSMQGVMCDVYVILRVAR
jgi:hypothetical protein